MIEVRIRHHTEGKSIPLCTWPATELDSLIPTLNAWGVTHVDSGDQAGGGVTGDLHGSIQVGDTAAYFEVVIGGE